MEFEYIAVIFCLGLTGMFLVMGIKANKYDQLIQARLDNILAKGEAKKVTRKKQLEGDFNQRVLFPFAIKFFDRIQRFIPLNSKSWVKAKLVQAGYTKSHYPKVFLGIQFLTTALMFGVLMAFTTVFGKVNGLIGIVVSVVFAGFGYGMPMVWLLQQAKKRQDSIQKALPDFLDLLVICVEAGLGLDVAISKIANLKTVKTSNYLREELMRYTKDVGFGKPRKEALLGMAERTGVDDLNVIINALVNAYEMGTGVSQTLRVQADSLRVKRLARAEERANKIPVKMVLPIYIFLFPAIFVCIFGPIGMVMFEAVMAIFANMQFGT